MWRHLMAPHSAEAESAPGTPEGPAICILPFWWFVRLFRAERPVGRGLAFAPGDVATGVRAVTAWPSLLPTSQARTPFGLPRGSPTRPRLRVDEGRTGFPRSAVEVCVR